MAFQHLNNVFTSDVEEWDTVTLKLLFVTDAHMH